MSQIPRLGFVAIPEAPGLTPRPAVSSEAERAYELERSLGLLGDAADSFAVYQARRQAQREKAEADAREYDEGLAVQESDRLLPVHEDRIRNREVLVPDGQDEGQWAREYAASLIPEDASPAFQDRFYRQTVERFAAAAVAQTRAIKNESRDNLTNVLFHAGVDETDPNAIGRLVGRAMELHPEWTRDEAQARIVLHSLSTYAQRGDVKLFTSTEAWMPAGYQPEIERLRNHLTEVADERASKERKAADDDIASFFVAREKYGPGAGYTFEAARQRALVLGEKLKDPSWTDDRLQEIDRREAAELSGTRKEALRLENEAMRSAVIDAARDAMREAAATGGAARIGAFTYVDSSGAEHTFTEAEIERQATNAEMEAIAKRHGDNAAAVLAEQVDFVAHNGIVHDPWRQIIEAGGSVLASDFDGGEEGSEPKPLPANAVDGIGLYRSLKAVSGKVASDHVSGQTRTLYDIADGLMRLGPYAGEPETALAVAFKAINSGVIQEGLSSVGANDPDFRDAVNSAVYVDGWGWWGQSDTRESDRTIDGKITYGNAPPLNIADIEAKVLFNARVFRATGMSNQAAVALAKETVADRHMLINGVAVDVGDRNVPMPVAASLQRVGPKVAEKYVAKYGEAEGIEAEDLTLWPGLVPGTWVIADANGQFAEHWRDPGIGFFDDIEILELDAAQTAVEDQQIADEALAKIRGRSLSERVKSRRPRMGYTRPQPQP